MKRLDDGLELQDQLSVHYTDARLTAGSQINYSLGRRHTNQTGFYLHRLFYDYDLQLAPGDAPPLRPIATGDGRSTLVQAYTQSKLDLSSRLAFNAGLHVQHFALTGHSTFEAREAASRFLDVTLLYRRNHRRHSEVWALQLKNALGNPARFLDFS